MMIPKQKPEKPAPPIAPSCAAVKPYCAPQLSKIPPRIAKPTPAAKMAMNPAINNRLAFGAMASLLTCTLLIVFWLVGLGLRTEKSECKRRQLYNGPAVERGLVGAE